MPISMETLPWFIQKQIAEKMKFVDFMAFEQASEQAVSTANRVKSIFLLPKEFSHTVHFKKIDEEVVCNIRREFWNEVRFFKVSDGPQIRFKTEKVYIDTPLDESFCQSLIGFFSNSQSTVSEFRIHEEEGRVIDSSPESLHQLLKAAEVKEFIALDGIIAPEAFEDIPECVKEITCNSPLEDSHLMKTTATFIHVRGTSISNQGINSFLKEWKEGKRTFESLTISSTESFKMYEILKDFKYSETGDLHFYRSFRIFEAENASELLKVTLVTDPEDRYIQILVKENFKKPEPFAEEMDYEEYWEEEDDEEMDKEDWNKEDEEEMEF